MLEPLSPELNVAILDMAALLLPDGFDISDNAPHTFDALKRHFHSGRRLVVWSGGSQASIYGDPGVNYAFRAWHDWCHCVGNHDFTLGGEAAACEMQCAQLITRFGDNAVTRRWCRILRAEIIGQALYFERYQRFPDDQYGFVVAYLRDANAALT